MSMQTTVKTLENHSIPTAGIAGLVLLAALAWGAASPSHAQTAAPSAAPPVSPPPQMSSGNAMGAIAQNKATTKDLEAAFSRADVDKDGRLSRQEIELFPELAQRFEQIDTNHDGFISRAEFSKAAGASAN